MRTILAWLRAAPRRLHRHEPPWLRAAVRRAWDTGATLGENPRWDATTGSVYWGDLPAGTLHRYGLRDGACTTWQLGPEIGAIAVTREGRVMVALGNRLAWFEPTTGLLTTWCDVPALDVARCRFNDAAWVPDGSLWLASMDRAGHEPLGALHRVGVDGKTSVLARDYIIANGPAVDARRGVAYVADSPRRTIHVLTLDAPNARRTFARLDEAEGYPDGMAVGDDGSLWVAHYDGACVSRWTPDGRCVGRLAMPVRRPTAIALVPDGQTGDTLVITSARDDTGGGELYVVTDLEGAPRTRGAG